MKTTAANSEFKYDAQDVKYGEDNDDSQQNQIENSVNKYQFDKHRNTQIQDLIKISSQKPKSNQGKSMSRAKSAGGFNIEEFIKR